MRRPKVEDSSFNDILEKYLHEKPLFTVEPAKPTDEERKKAAIMQLILDKHFENDDNVVEFNKTVRKKFREYVKHYMTCTDPTHMHEVVHTRWDNNEL